MRRSPHFMTPVERSSLESQVERHIRRGEMPEAWSTLHILCGAFPDDEALRERLERLEQNLDPEERRRVSPSGITRAIKFATPMHEAEALAGAGKYKESISIYRALLVERPDLELVKERLAELFQLAQVAAPPRQPLSQINFLEHLLSRISARKRVQ